MKSHCALLAALLLGAAFPANATIGSSDGAPHADAMRNGSYVQLARGGGGFHGGGGGHAGGANFGGNIRGGSSPTINHTTNVNIGSNNYHGGGNNIHGETYNGGGGTYIHGETYHGGGTYIHGETYHYYNGWDDHPIAAGVAFGTAAAVTAAAIGSVVYSVPSSCGTVIVNGFSYYQCGSVWYRPQYYGTTVQYVVVTAPR